MIRREATDGAWMLITQNDHALLSGRLAQRLDGRVIKRPEPCEPVMSAIAMHDSGWPEHDEQPTLNARGFPLDVFETPREIGLKAWALSVERATEAHPYAGLLVSLHVLSLSQLLENTSIWARDRFEINKFHHREIERQESLRRTLGLRTDLPLHSGLAKSHSSPREDALRFHFRLLQAMDRISLALCCTNEPFSGIDRLSFQPGGEERAVAFNRDTQDDALSLDPWPFDAAELHEQVPCRRIGARAFVDVAEFRATFDGAPIEPFAMTLRKR